MRRIERPNESEHLPRPVSNKIQYFVLQEHANVLQARPTVDVLPASEDPMAISNAAVAKAYLEWLADPQVMDWDATLSIATLWALAGTESFIKWVWNPRLKRPDAIACSPLDIYPDPFAREFKNARYVIHSQFMDVEQVYDIYGVEVKPTTIEHTDPVRIALMREMGMAPVLQGALVNELWYLPSRRHPDGIFTTWAGRDTLVPVSPFPYEHKQLPFTQIGSIVRPGTQHYTSAVSALRTPQMELNKFHGQMIQVREAFANPKWWIPDEMDLESDPDDSPRQILRGNSNGGTLEPKIIAPSAMPPNDAGAWIANEMMNVVGQHEVSQAQVPGRVEAAQAIEMLQEQDNGRLMELRNTIKRSISVGYYQALRLVQQYGNADNLFTAYSPEGFPEAQRLFKTQLDPAMKIRVTMGTGLANSRAARNDQLMTMWQQQIIKDPEVMAELLDIPISSVSPDNMYDIRLARNENLKMATDIAIMPNSWDNHDIHRREHNNYRKTSEYANLSMDEKSKFEFHCQMHDQLQIQQLGKQLQIQSMAAAVAQGQGFQNPQAPGPTASDTSGGQPGQPAPQQPSQAPPQGPSGGGVILDPVTGRPVVPQGMGSQGSPPNPEEARMTPQGVANIQNRFAGQFQKLSG